MLTGLLVDCICGGAGEALWLVFSMSSSFAKAASWASFAVLSIAGAVCSSSTGGGGGGARTTVLTGAGRSCLGSSFAPKMEANLDLVGFVLTATPSADLSLSNLAKNLSTEAFESETTLGGGLSLATSFCVGSICAGLSSVVVLFFIISIHSRKSS